MLLHVLILLLSVVLLVAGAEVLVRGAVGLATRMGLSTFFIGMTIVGFGTSTPELATSLYAGLRGSPDISLGNVVGSNIFNVAVTLGITALICPIPVRLEAVRRQLAIVILAAFAPYLALFSAGVLTRLDGAVLAGGLVLFLAYGYATERKQPRESERLAGELVAEFGLQGPSVWKRTVPSVAGVVLGIVVLWLGARLLVQSSVSIARAFHVSELAIGLTIVATGTSLPELFTSAVAARRGESDISVGNILGSNIFNMLGIAGITCLVHPQRVSPQIMWMDAPLMIFLSVACLPIMFTGGRISRGEGAAFLGVYAAYLALLILLAPDRFA